MSNTAPSKKFPECEVVCMECEVRHCAPTATCQYGCEHRYDNVSCSQCGRNFGPGDIGFSHCEDHGDDLDPDEGFDREFDTWRDDQLCEGGR